MLEVGGGLKAKLREAGRNCRARCSLGPQACGALFKMRHVKGGAVELLPPCTDACPDKDLPEGEVDRLVKTAKQRLTAIEKLETPTAESHPSTEKIFHPVELGGVLCHVISVEGLNKLLPDVNDTIGTQVLNKIGEALYGRPEYEGIFVLSEELQSALDSRGDKFIVVERIVELKALIETLVAAGKIKKWGPRSQELTYLVHQRADEANLIKNNIE